MVSRYAEDTKTDGRVHSEGGCHKVTVGSRSNGKWSGDCNWNLNQDVLENRETLGYKYIQCPP